MLLQDLAPLGELQCVDRSLRGAQLPLQLIGQESLDPIQAAPEQGGVWRRCTGHFFGHRGAECEEGREARILHARIAKAHLADPVEQAPHRVVIRIEHGMFGKHEAQDGDLHAREHRPERAGQLRVAEERFEQAGRQLDDLAIDRLAGTGHERRPMLLEAIAAWRSAAGQGNFGGRVAQQLVETKQGLLELGIAAGCAVAAHGRARTVAVFGAAVAAPLGAERHARHARQEGAQCAGSRRLGDGEAAEAGARGQDHRSVGTRLDACRLEPRRCGGPRVLQQARQHAGRRAQNDGALNLRVYDRACGVPQRRGVDQGPERIRLGVDVGLTRERRGEGLQLAQFPFGGAVDELHGARDLDVDLDARFIHQLQAAKTGTHFGKAGFARPVDLFSHAFRQRLDEGLFVQRRIALQRLDDFGVMATLACTRRAALLRRA